MTSAVKVINSILIPLLWAITGSNIHYLSTTQADIGPVQWAVGLLPGFAAAVVGVVSSVYLWRKNLSVSDPNPSVNSAVGLLGKMAEIAVKTNNVKALSDISALSVSIRK